VGTYLRELQDGLDRPLVIGDIGCGDCQIGTALMQLVPDARYLGFDVVRPLIENHSRHLGSERMAFEVLDIVTDKPPPADIFLVRQVFQHLSNLEIASALANLAGSRVMVTEGQPEFPEGKPNPDKAVGAGIRFHWASGTGRGVELDLPPFNRTVKELFRTFSPPHELIVTALVEA
jgi:hypothetical protein